MDSGVYKEVRREHFETELEQWDRRSKRTIPRNLNQNGSMVKENESAKARMGVTDP